VPPVVGGTPALFEFEGAAALCRDGEQPLFAAATRLVSEMAWQLLQRQFFAGARALRVSPTAAVWAVGAGVDQCDVCFDGGFHPHSNKAGCGVYVSPTIFLFLKNWAAASTRPLRKRKELCGAPPGSGYCQMQSPHPSSARPRR
jgi:hypothetical protein